MSQTGPQSEGSGPSPVPPFGSFSVPEESTVGANPELRIGSTDHSFGPSADPAATPRGGRRLGLLAVAISLLALVVALSSTVFAWRAIDQAADAKDIAIGRGPVQPAGNGGIVPATTPAGQVEEPDNGVSESPTVPAADPNDVPRSPGEPPELNDRTIYEVKYTKQTLTLNAPCNQSMYADLDEPRANVSSDAYDLRLRAGCGSDPSNLRLAEGVEGSESAKPGMTPQECADNVRRAPVPTDAPIPVRKGVMLCVMTDYAAARARGDQWRMILLEIVAVSNDGAVTIQASAWNIPG